MYGVVRRETRTLPLDEGHTVTVRRRLNYGEQSEMFARMYAPGADGRLHVDVLKSDTALIHAYVLGWTLTDLDGAPLPCPADLDPDGFEAVLRELDPEDVGAIKRAIDAHATAEAEARAAEKKSRAGSNGSSNPSGSAA